LFGNVGKKTAPRIIHYTGSHGTTEYYMAQVLSNCYCRVEFWDTKYNKPELKESTDKLRNYVVVRSSSASVESMMKSLERPNAPNYGEVFWLDDMYSDSESSRINYNNLKCRILASLKPKLAMVKIMTGVESVVPTGEGCFYLKTSSELPFHEVHELRCVVTDVEKITYEMCDTNKIKFDLMSAAKMCYDLENLADYLKDTPARERPKKEEKPKSVPIVENKKAKNRKRNKKQNEKKQQQTPSRTKSRVSEQAQLGEAGLAEKNPGPSFPFSYMFACLHCGKRVVSDDECDYVWLECECGSPRIWLHDGRVFGMEGIVPFLIENHVQGGYAKFLPLELMETFDFKAFVSESVEGLRIWYMEKFNVDLFVGEMFRWEISFYDEDGGIFEENIKVLVTIDGEYVIQSADTEPELTYSD